METGYYTIESDDLHSFKFSKHLLKGIYVIEEYLDKNKETVCNSYRCDGFTQGDYDTYIIRNITKALNKRPKTMLLSRWQPHMNPQTFISFGDYFISTRFDMIEDIPVLSFKTCKTVDKENFYRMYRLVGEHKIKSFINFLKS